MPPKASVYGYHQTIRKSERIIQTTRNPHLRLFSYDQEMQLKKMEEYLTKRTSPQKRHQLTYQSRILNKKSTKKTPYQNKNKKKNTKKNVQKNHHNYQTSSKDKEEQITIYQQEEEEGHSSDWKDHQDQYDSEWQDNSTAKNHFEQEQGPEKPQKTSRQKSKKKSQKKVSEKPKSKSRQKTQQKKSKQKARSKSKKKIETKSQEKVEKSKKKPKTKNLNKLSSYEQSIIKIITNQTKLLCDLSPQEFEQCMKGVLGTLVEIGHSDSSLPPYYTRLTMEGDKRAMKMLEDERKLAELAEEKGGYIPFIFPEPGKLTKSYKQKIFTQVSWSRKAHMKGGANYEEKLLELKKKQEQMDKRIWEGDSFLEQEIPDDTVSSQYIIEEVPIKLRHRDDLPEYYEKGMNWLNNLWKGQQLEDYLDPETFHQKLVLSFNMLDDNYYRSLDPKNAGFSGYLETDEPYAKDMPYHLLFPELHEMFNFPEKLNESDAENPYEDEVEEKRRKEFESAQHLYQEQIKRGQKRESEYIKQGERRESENPYIQYFDKHPMEESYFKELEEKTMKEFEQYRKKNEQKSYLDSHTKRWTNRWDYFTGSQRLRDDEEQESVDLSEDSESLPNSQTKTAGPQQMISKTKSMQPKQELSMSMNNSMSRAARWTKGSKLDVSTRLRKTNGKKSLKEESLGSICRQIRKIEQKY